MGAITDVENVLVGHAADLKAGTGCTVIHVEGGAVGGVDIRGGAASTRGTEVLSPLNVVDHIDAVVLTGGSAFGLDALCGVTEELERRGIGFDVGITRVPIVAGAVLFDLWIGSATVRPDRRMGRAALAAASAGLVAEGNAGAGVGATVGKLFGISGAMKSGVGTASVPLKRGVVVGALVVVNAFGDVRNHCTGQLLAGPRDPATGKVTSTVQQMKRGRLRPSFSAPATNTTLGVVATNAVLSKSEAWKLAQIAHNGLALTISPAHTYFDGDTMFALSTSRRKADINLLGAAAVEVVAEAIVRAVTQAEPLYGVPACGWERR